MTASASSGSPSWRSTIQPIGLTGSNAGHERVGDERHAFAPRVARAACRAHRARFAISETACPIPVPRRAAARARARRTRSARGAATSGRCGEARCGDESVTKRDSSRRAGRMLQRPPPLIRILRPPSFVRSSEQRLRALRRREDRRHRAGRAGADYDNARHASSDWRNVRLKRPDELELGRSRARRDARHTVIAQPRRPAEHERISRFERDGLDRIAPLEPAEQKARGVADRHRHDRNAGGNRRRDLRPCPGAVPSCRPRRSS